MGYDVIEIHQPQADASKTIVANKPVAPPKVAPQQPPTESIPAPKRKPAWTKRDGWAKPPQPKPPLKEYNVVTKQDDANDAELIKHLRKAGPVKRGPNPGSRKALMNYAMVDLDSSAEQEVQDEAESKSLGLDTQWERYTGADCAYPEADDAPRTGLVDVSVFSDWPK